MRQNRIEDTPDRLSSPTRQAATDLAVHLVHFVHFVHAPLAAPVATRRNAAGTAGIGRRVARAWRTRRRESPSPPAQARCTRPRPPPPARKSQPTALSPVSSGTCRPTPAPKACPPPA